MSTKSTAREQILGRIRAALRDVPSNEQPQDVVVPLDYRRSETAPREEVVERFAERVAEYKVTVQRVEEASLPQAIATASSPLLWHLGSRPAVEKSKSSAWPAARAPRAATPPGRRAA